MFELHTVNSFCFCVSRRHCFQQPPRTDSIRPSNPNFLAYRNSCTYVLNRPISKLRGRNMIVVRQIECLSQSQTLNTTLVEPERQTEPNLHGQIERKLTRWRIYFTDTISSALFLAKWDSKTQFLSFIEFAGMFSTAICHNIVLFLINFCPHHFNVFEKLFRPPAKKKFFL